jgi:membrane fusion protein, multidrug efflux system
MIQTESVQPDFNLPKKGGRSGPKIGWIIFAIILFGSGFFVYSHYNKPQADGKTTEVKKTAGKTDALPTPVVAVSARAEDVGVYLSGLGSVTPLNTVNVRSRVDGQLMELNFQEGQHIAKGDLLAVIDPRPFQVQLTQAEGQMTRDKEQLNNARTDLQRYKQLWRLDSIPRQQLESQEALVRQLEGTVKVDQGQIESAKLQLTYSRINAPISGRVGLRIIDPGNMIHANDVNGVVVITQLQPIAVVFTVPEDSLSRILPKMKSGARLAVEVYDREQKQQLSTGTLSSIDNQIDPTTGTVKLKAVFPNKNDELFPNQFVNARLLIETLPNAIVVPGTAIQRGAQGTFVYRVSSENTVSVHPVSVGPTKNGDITIASGLSAGDKVVVDGAERLREGSKVEVREPGKREGADKGNDSKKELAPPRRESPQRSENP